MKVSAKSGASDPTDHPDSDAPGVPVAFEVHDLLSHLLRRAHFAAEAAFPDAYKGHEVTSRQMALLFAVNRRQGASQAELAEVVGFDANTFSDVVKRSERKGLLYRVRSTDDRRAFGLHLTEAGRDMVASAAELTPAYQARIAAHLDQEEAQQLVELLRKMLNLR